MSEFLGKRLVRIELVDSSRPLPEALGPFGLCRSERGADLFELPYCSLNSQTWGEFERVMYTLKVRGESNGWRLMDGR